MSDIVLSNATRNSLLSLQNTSALQQATQSRLATGKKVNTALDNATSFFTAQGFNNRASSLTALLDSVSNSVQTLKTADAGITSITKLIAQLKSTAQQALQSPSAYTSQATIASTSPFAGASAADLRGIGRERDRHWHRRPQLLYGGCGATPATWSSTASRWRSPPATRLTPSSPRSTTRPISG